MSTSGGLRVLGERLGRLTGDDPDCCVAEYEGEARAIAGSSDFRAALKQLRALGDENRLLAVWMLRRKAELCACEIQAATGLTHATVSHHMALLEEAGLVIARRHGKWQYYSLTSDAQGILP